LNGAPRLLLSELIYLRLQALPVWLAIWIAVLVTVGRQSRLDWTEIAAFIALSVLQAIGLLLLAVLRGQLRFRAAAMAQVGGRIAAVAAAMTLLLLGVMDSPATLALCLVFGELILVSAAVGATNVATTWSDQSTSTLSLRAAVPFGVNVVLAAAYNRLDILLVASLTTTTQLGFYAAASRVQDGAYGLPVALGAMMLPLITAARDRARRLTTTALVGSLVVSVPLTLALWIACPLVVEFLFGPAYLGAVGPTRIVLASLILASIGAPLTAALMARGYESQTMRAYLVAFVVAIGTHLALDPWLGATGAAIASVARDAANVAVIVYLHQRLMSDSE
jgi:O-antigen/teichoic acid export membrane protein